MLPNYINTHFHLNDEMENDDAVSAIERSLFEGTWVILVTHDYDSSARALDIAHQFPRGVYVSAGLHPMRLDATSSLRNYDLVEYDRFRSLARDPRVVALGDVGMDFHSAVADVSTQRHVFDMFLRLAGELRLPLILVARDAHDAVQDHLRTFGASREGIGVRGVVHHFTGSAENARVYHDHDFVLSFTDVLADSHARRELISQTPQSHVLVESLCPFFKTDAVQASHGSAHLPHTIDKLAAIRGTPRDETRADITRNALRLFPRIVRSLPPL